MLRMKVKITSLVEHILRLFFEKKGVNKITPKLKTKILEQILSNSYNISEGGIQVDIIEENGDKLAEFKLMQFPGCCGILILYNVYVFFPNQKKGIGTEIFKFAKEIAKELNYSKLICTDVVGKPSEKILLNIGFKHINTFVNQKTTNTVNISAIDI